MDRGTLVRLLPSRAGPAPPHDPSEMTIAAAPPRRSDVGVPTSADEPEQHPGAVKAGLLLTYLSAATVPWTAVHVTGTVDLGDVLLILAAMTLLLADLRRRLINPPPWVWIFAVTVLIVATVTVFDPPSLAYLTERARITGATGNPVQWSSLPFSNLIVMVPLLVRIILPPVAFALARTYDSRALFRIAMSFVAGSAISAAIAFSDSRGITSIGPSLLHIPVYQGRAAGLTEQTNVVAMGCVCSLPLAIWQTAAQRGRRRILAAVALLALGLGLLASRSRSGAGAAGVAGLVALGWLPQYRRHLPTVAFFLGVVVAILFAANPGLGTSLLHELRITGSDTSGSDAARGRVNSEAVRDFLHSPIHGIGLEIADLAHDIYLQVLAVGGLILLTGFVIYQLGALSRCIRLAKVEPLAIPLFVSVLGLIAFNALQNALTPTLSYLSSGLVAALPLVAARQRAPD